MLSNSGIFDNALVETFASKKTRGAFWWIWCKQASERGGRGQNQKLTMPPILCIHDAVSIHRNVNETINRNVAKQFRNVIGF